MEEVKGVVGVVFIKDGKLLIVQSLRSQTTNTWTLIGGGIESGESAIEACIREVKEEFHNGFMIDENDLIPLMGFREVAASDPHLIVEMNIFLCQKEVEGILVPDEEILRYHWFEIGEKDYNLSSAIIDHFLPYAIDKGLLY